MITQDLHILGKSPSRSSFLHKLKFLLYATAYMFMHIQLHELLQAVLYFATDFKAVISWKNHCCGPFSVLQSTRE